MSGGDDDEEQGGAYNAGCRPDISTCIPLGAKNNLGAAILPRLNVISEMVLDPRRIP